MYTNNTVLLFIFFLEKKERKKRREGREEVINRKFINNYLILHLLWACALWYSG